MFFASILLWSVQSYICACLSTGHIRLSSTGDHSTPQRGYVEMYIKQRWLPVLDRNCTMSEATVICSQLGYEAVSDIYRLDLCYTPMSYISSITCSGTEVSLAQCKYSISNDQSHGQTACGISCANRFNVRIADHGVLMMYYDRKWIPVCSESINQLEVNVACRELGYEAGDQEIMDSTDNNTALYFDGNCTGEEFLFKQCSSNGYQEDTQYTIVADCSSFTVIQCFGILTPPCPPVVSQVSCDSLSLSFPVLNTTYSTMLQQFTPSLPFVNEWSTTAGRHYISTYINTTEVTVSGLIPSTLYQFRLLICNEYSNYTRHSNTVTVATIPPELPVTEIIDVLNITNDKVSITWQISSFPCFSVTVTGFVISLNDSSLKAILYNYLTDNSSVSLYMYTVPVQPDTVYTVTIRAISDTSSGLIYGNASEPLIFATQKNSSFLFNVNPYVSLIFNLLFVVLIIVIILTLCLCLLVKYVYKNIREKKIRSPNSLYETDNIYATGDLSDQSYIPMSSTNYRQRAATVSLPVISNLEQSDSYWIDLPDVPELSTFPTHSEDERSFKSSDSNFAFVLRERIIIRNSAADDASSYMDDNPYDEIPGTALVNSLSETEEKVYDEIKEGLINTQLEEDVATLTPDDTSEEPFEITIVPVVIPPPKEFADLPERRTSSLTTPAHSNATHPRHERHHSMDDKSTILKPAVSQMVLSHAPGGRERKIYRTGSTPRLDIVVTRPEARPESPYYNIPPYFSKNDLKSTRNTSPEYEILLNPRSASASTTPIKKRRTPPPVPPRPPSHVMAAIKKKSSSFK